MLAGSRGQPENSNARMKGEEGTGWVVQFDPLRPAVEKLDVFKGRQLKVIRGGKAA
jgi:hypothetical protein